VFSIHLPEGEPWYSDQRRVLDTERRISLQFTGGIGSEGVRGFLLSHRAMRLPFATAERTSDAEGGPRYFVYEIVSFPAPFYVPAGSETPAGGFSSSDETNSWRRTAAEALLVFGRDYNGFDLDADYARVQMEGELLTRRDFGYTH
jgi:hypothetical protein